MRPLLAAVLALAARAASAAGPFAPVPVAFEASATLPPSASARYDASNLADGNPATAWAVGKREPGAWVTVTARLAAPRPARAVEIAVANGYQKSDAALDANAAARELRTAVLAASGETIVEQVLTLEKKRGTQRFVLELPAGAAVAAVRFVLVSVHPGKKYEDTCISEVAIALSDAPAPAQGAMPTTLSGFDGWRGFRLARDGRGRSRLVFPAGFGRNPEQLQLLAAMAAGKKDVELDVEGAELPAYAAMGQLRKLVAEYQDRAAAELIVRMETEGGVWLGGGELSESYAYELLAPTLVAFKDIGAVVPPPLEQHVADSICAGVYRNATGDELDEQKVLRALDAHGAKRLAGKIRATCKKMAAGEE